MQYLGNDSNVTVIVRASYSSLLLSTVAGVVETSRYGVVVIHHHWRPSVRVMHCRALYSTVQHCHRGYAGNEDYGAIIVYFVKIMDSFLLGLELRHAWQRMTLCVL